MPSFFVFAVIFTIFMVEGRTAALMALLELLIYTGICVYAYYRPGAVTFFRNEGAVLADVIFGFVTTSLALGITMFLQLRLYKNYQKELEEALRLSRVKSAFLSNMNHEIRTPINVMLGMNEMILRLSEWEQGLRYFSADAGQYRKTAAMFLTGTCQSGFGIGGITNFIAAISGEQGSRKPPTFPFIPGALPGDR
jgi:signal transduction histidine kinase